MTSLNEWRRIGGLIVGLILMGAPTGLNGEEDELMLPKFVVPKHYKYKESFVMADGVELIIIIMKQKKLAYGSAIRALDFAMTKYPPACERFVNVLGLKTISAALKVEGIVKQLAVAGDHDKMATIIQLLTNEYTFSPQANHRKGRLIGLAAATMGLSSEAAQDLELIVPPVLKPFLDQES